MTTKFYDQEVHDYEVVYDSPNGWVEVVAIQMLPTGYTEDVTAGVPERMPGDRQFCQELIEYMLENDSTLAGRLRTVMTEEIGSHWTPFVPVFLSHKDDGSCHITCRED